MCGPAGDRCQDVPMIRSLRPWRSAARPGPVAAPAIAVALLLVSACSGGDANGDGGADVAAPTLDEQPAGEVDIPGEEEGADEEPDGEEEGGTAPYAGYEGYAPAQYAATSNWICHPDLQDDQCRDLATTVVEPDGTRRLDDLQPAEEPTFDCFYVYPTTSGDPSPVSDLIVDDPEISTVKAQVARYASQCRVFAPAYRQVTLTGLGGGAGQAEREQAYADVLDAWKSYVVQSNDGRGVVLLGHSQGAGHLRRLLVEELDDDADLRSLLISAVLLGTSVSVPEGELVGGDLQEIPACTTADTFGCVISYSSYPADAPPGEGAIFGRADEGQRALCVDPAELAGVDGPIAAVLPSTPSLLGGIAGFEDVGTPYVSISDSVLTSCVQTGDYTYLGVALADPDDSRPVAGLVQQRLGPTWGLHLLDANIGQDVLIDVVTRQAGARAEGA